MKGRASHAFFVFRGGAMEKTVLYLLRLNLDNESSRGVKKGDRRKEKIMPKSSLSPFIVLLSAPEAPPPLFLFI